MTTGQTNIWRAHVRQAYNEAVKEKRLFSQLWHS